MIIWLASYPKSGNTWIRTFISSIIFSKDGISNFNNLEKIPQYPMRRHFHNLVENFQNINEIKKNWIISQDKMNLDNKIKFLKTHHVNCKIGTDSFTNLDNTKGVIYIVRDPRNIISSLSNHYQHDFKFSTDFLLNEKSFLSNKDPNYKTEENIITLLGSWKNHYNSWKISSNLLLIRYEDLILDVKSQVNRLSNFLKKFAYFYTNEIKINNIIETTSFELLKKKEENEGFEEAVNSKIKFFNSGPKSNWKNIIDEKLIHKIEKSFEKEMKELNYLS